MNQQARSEPGSRPAGAWNTLQEEDPGPSLSQGLLLNMVAGEVTAVNGQPREGELEGTEAVIEATLTTEDL